MHGRIEICGLKEQVEKVAAVLRKFGFKDGDEIQIQDDDPEISVLDIHPNRTAEPPPEGEERSEIINWTFKYRRGEVYFAFLIPDGDVYCEAAVVAELHYATSVADVSGKQQRPV